MARDGVLSTPQRVLSTSFLLSTPVRTPPKLSVHGNTSYFYFVWWVDRAKPNHPRVRKAATHQIIAHALLAPAAIVHLHDRQASCAPAKRVPSVPPDAHARGDATLRPRLALQVFLTMAAAETTKRA